VVDAAHGGADNGARGPNGVNEKDVVLALARGIRADLVRQGYRVVMTRDSDADPTFDDRATIANQFANAIFVTLHVASTGTPGTVRAYYYHATTPFTVTLSQNPSADEQAPAPAVIPLIPRAPNGATAAGLIPWREAQVKFIDQSHRFADLVQNVLAQKFSTSPAASAPSSVRELRSVAAPAIAIELSSVGSSSASALEAMGPSIAAAVDQSIVAFRPPVAAPAAPAPATAPAPPPPATPVPGGNR
jgi:N-acetylmuramoyl-L-alanine amidase